MQSIQNAKTYTGSQLIRDGRVKGENPEVLFLNAYNGLDPLNMFLNTLISSPREINLESSQVKLLLRIKNSMVGLYSAIANLEKRIPLKSDEKRERLKRSPRVTRF